MGGCKQLSQLTAACSCVTGGKFPAVPVMGYTLDAPPTPTVNLLIVWLYFYKKIKKPSTRQKSPDSLKETKVVGSDCAFSFCFFYTALFIRSGAMFTFAHVMLCKELNKISPDTLHSLKRSCR